LETTGTWIEKDRIIEIALIKINVDNTEETFESKVNPLMPIPPVVSELTGIKNEDVQNAPTFVNIAAKVVQFIGDADLAGFNAERFDIPLLMREFSDIGVKFEMSGRMIFDAQKVYHLHQKRDLSAAYAFYCKKDLKNAHSALADTRATLDILEEQINLYGNGNTHIDSLKDFNYKQTSDYFDNDRKFRWWNGELYMTFGKYAKKESLRVIAQKDPYYLQWILDKDFSEEVKAMVQDVINGQHPKQA
jgi:DNA polymerase-3 subunit epsilon